MAIIGGSGKKSVNKDSVVDYIIGLPPGYLEDGTIQGRSQTVMENSMPLVKIYPGIPGI